MQKGFGQIYIFIGVIIIVLTVSGIIYFGKLYQWLPNSNPTQNACTMEAKICPDGSGVGRSGPNCEFTLCPSNSSDLDETSNWKTFSSNDINYTFQYPTSAEISTLSKNIYLNTANYVVINNIGGFGTHITILPSQLYSQDTNIQTNPNNQKIYSAKIAGLNVSGIEKIDNKGDTFIELKSNGYLFQIAINNDNSETKKLVTKILSTVKFLK